jgi:hypothetical protein
MRFILFIMAEFFSPLVARHRIRVECRMLLPPSDGYLFGPLEEAVAEPAP